MIALLITSTKIIRTFLPKKVFGDYWIIDIENDEQIINIEEENNKWKIKSNPNYTLIDEQQKEVEELFLENYLLTYVRVNKNNEVYLLYIEPTFDETVKHLELNKTKITIGSSNDNDIIYNNNLISELHATLTFENNHWILTDNNTKLGVFVNDTREKKCIIDYGDAIFILGLKIIILKDRIIVNNPNNLVDYSKFKVIPLEKLELKLKEINEELEENIELYKEEDYFLRAPRFKTSIEKQTMVIDPPPGKIAQEEMPAIFVIGSSLTVSSMSIMTIFTTLDSVMSGSRTMKSALPSLIGGVVMLLSMLLWPMLNRKYQKKMRIKKEAQRQEKYSKYISKKETEIDMIMRNQTQILHENYIPSKECENIIISKNRQLWERKIEQMDFLKVRLGLGNLPVELDIRYPEEHFTMEEDNLKDVLNRVVYKSKILENVPITVSLTEKYILALVGKHNELSDFIKRIILQLVTFHSYEDLKLVFFTNHENEETWDYVKSLPHVWSNDKKTRYFATTYEEMQQLSAILEKEFQERKSNNDKNYKNFLPYYIIITDDYSVSRNIEIVIDSLKEKINIGFSVLVMNENLSTLPNECTTFINVSNMKGGIFESELVSTKQKEFVVDPYDEIDFKKCFMVLNNTPIRFSNQLYSLPNTFTFLEMYNVGKVEQLNSLARWKMNDSTLSLQVPVGIDTHGMLFNVDIHEKAHGPHGLVAGMTGSGKSEFLIAYILSLAVNYHPEDVSFILIDYKGGGLAGAFENDMTGVKLPHLAGKITNLDTREMQRALLSIQSELRRRQQIFNDTRKKLNEGIIDIYKYQKLYHSGLVTEPISHLLIISDEFAELKTQQPEFMDQLISTARIGRSLGVHLILATQKPSGIVNDQIRSNSRFKICLKVQEKSDSMDVINTADAAMLKQPGRFYLQVGYNEYYALGQSAFAGAPYIPSDKLQKKVDKSINFINNIGATIKEVEEIPKFNLTVKGEQVTNIVKYLSDIAKMNNIKIKQLWLSKIPGIVKIKDLLEKYNYQKSNKLNIVIGEYDDPFNQRKDALEYNLLTDGNLVIHGVTGSGKEMLLSTIIYGIITNYSALECNIYILDFGTNMLKMYKDMPQVGDFIVDDNPDKINNLFKMLNDEIDYRKKILQESGSSYSEYIKNNNLPLIVVILNNYEVFNELYNDYDDEIISLTREGLKYGITFIVTTTSSSLRYKLVQNFAQRLVLRMNDESDYSSILGNVNKLYPAKFIGRGLMKKEGIYEFQTATIEEDNLQEYIDTLEIELNQKYKEKAKKVPVLPNVVTLDLVLNSFKNLNTVPVGIEKETLNISTCDIKKNLINVISSQDITKNTNFIYSFMKELELVNNNNLIIIDRMKILKNEVFKNSLYYNEIDAYDNLLKVIEMYNNSDKKLKHNTVIIIGFDNFVNEIEKMDINKLFKEAKKTNSFNFIIIDNESSIKKYNYDDWYRNNGVGNSGIWLGSGITEQYVIKIAKMDRKLYQEIKSDFGYKVENGIPVLVKLINFVGDDDE
ncbi:MAG: type VII secretion protein EssC [Firmicutes bacterium]|nr:type VII secretion protein EssC [Bacillota bacterium]